jgi:hypothetical protein
VYCNGNTDKVAFDGKLEFSVKIIPYEGGISWVENTILEAIACRTSTKLPNPGAACDYCKYREAVRKFVA